MHSRPYFVDWALEHCIVLYFTEYDKWSPISTKIKMLYLILQSNASPNHEKFSE